MTESEKRVHVRVPGASDSADAPESPRRGASELDQRFKDYSGRLGNFAAQLGGARFASPPGLLDSRAGWSECIDLFDSGAEYRVLVEVPGFTREELDIAVTDKGVRMVAGRRPGVYGSGPPLVRRGSAPSVFVRSLAFPEEVVAKRAEATLNNGVLEVRVPKKVATSAAKHKVITR